MHEADWFLVNRTRAEYFSMFAHSNVPLGMVNRKYYLHTYGGAGGQPVSMVCFSDGASLSADECLSAVH
jgi:hypothetical protein